MAYKMKIRQPHQRFCRSFDLLSHSYIERSDKMLLVTEKKEVIEMPQWSKCEVRFGEDLMAAQKETRERAEKAKAAQQPYTESVDADVPRVQE